MRLRALLGAALVATLASACAGTDVGGSNPAQRVRAWASASNLSGSTATLRDDLSRVATARRDDDMIGMKTECAVLIADVRTAYGELTTPDPELTTDLSNAYDALARSASSCYSGATAKNDKALAYAAGQTNVGLGWLSRAEERLRTFGIG